MTTNNEHGSLEGSNYYEIHPIIKVVTKFSMKSERNLYVPKTLLKHTLLATREFNILLK